MNKHIRLKELQSRLLGVELDLDLIEQDLDNVVSDMNYLHLIEDETVYNINILKKKGVIAELKSYRQAWVKLAHIRTKIQDLKSKKSLLEVKLSNKVIAKEYYDREWEDLHREMEDDKIILIFKKRENET